MKIAFLTRSMDLKGGEGRYVSTLVEGARKNGHEVIILKETDDGHEGVPILKRGFGIFKSAWKAYDYLEHCDIVHALDVYPYGIIAWLASRSFRNRLIITAQGTYSIAPFYNLKTAILSRLAVRGADVVAVSNFTKDEMLNVSSPKSIQVINPGIDLKKFYQPRDTAVPFGDYILSVGALKPRKGYEPAIGAFAIAKVRFKNLKYKIVGNGNDAYCSELKALAKLHDVENDVEFISDISDEQLKQLYKAARLFLLPSINDGHHVEGFGLVFLEAAASGLPVVGTLGNGIEDAVGDNGILVDQNDVDGTVQAIVKILEDWKNYSDKSYEWARAHSIEDTVKKYNDFL